MKEGLIVIKRMDFITIAIVLCAMLLVGVPLLISGCTRPTYDTDDIDGGVQHSEDTGAPKTIYSTKIISFHCEFSTTLVTGEKVLHRQSLFCKDHGYDEKEAFL